MHGRRTTSSLRSWRGGSRRDPLSGAVREVRGSAGRLTEAKAIAGHGGWLPWLDREFGWSIPTAERFMRCHELATKNVNLTNLDIGVSALYALAAPSTPAAAREAVIAEAAKARRS